jgi:capsule polysaccharide export protein KpsC/LpsZ
MDGDFNCQLVDNDFRIGNSKQMDGSKQSLRLAIITGNVFSSCMDTLGNRRKITSPIRIENLIFTTDTDLILNFNVVGVHRRHGLDN